MKLMLIMSVNVSIPSEVKEIGELCFKSLRIESVNISNGVKKIANGAFANCSSLTSIDISNIIEKGTTEIVSNIKNLKKLKKVVLSNGIVGFENKALSGCVSLEKINIPGSVKNLGWGTFRGCSSLREIRIPVSV